MKNRIALLGQPNSGKSTVFNALTGSRQHVGNWPGKTVEKNDGYYTFEGTRFTVTDLPGSYGLSGNSDEEVITTEFIKSGQADLVCILVDASQLERSMYMAAEFAPLDQPAVLLLNMMDVAKAQNKEIDHELLQKRLGIPVRPFTAADGKGYDGLRDRNWSILTSLRLCRNCRRQPPRPQARPQTRSRRKARRNTGGSERYWGV